MEFEKDNRDKFGRTRLGVVDEEEEEEFDDFDCFPFFFGVAANFVETRENSSRFGQVERSLNNSSSMVVPFFLMSGNARQ